MKEINDRVHLELRIGESKCENVAIRLVKIEGRTLY